MYPNDQFANRISVLLTGIFASVALQLAVEDKIPKFLYVNFLNLSVFLGLIVMAYGCVFSWVLKLLNENEYKLAAIKIAQFMVVW